ncbi:MAG: integrase [Pseudomonadota bacterium]
MYVASQMGHKDWSFTAKTYARWIKTNDEDGRKGERVFASVV